MNKKTIVPALVLGLGSVLGACTPAQAAGGAGGLNVQEQNRALVQEFIQDGLEAGDAAVVARLVAEDMVQHNPGAQDGRAGVLAFLQVLPEPLDYDVERVLAEGDLVIVHSRLQLFGQQNAAFDIFRVADGQIVEHWDVLQANEPDAKNPSGRTALDGPTTIVDPDRTAANKALMERFYAEVFIGGELDRMDKYFEGDAYLQHNPGVGDGVSNLRNVLQGGAGFTVKIDRVARTVAEGNFVFVHAGGSVDGAPTAFADLYRLENGKIAEHWDVIQAVPEESANTNGML